MTPSRLVLDPSDKCIYCSATENLKMEHIIPLSLGGRIELPNSSCGDCEKITSALELKIARGLLSIPRSISGVQTRRRKKRARTSELELKFSDGRTVKRKFSLDKAPISSIIPIFTPVEPDFETGELRSKCTFRCVDHRDNQARFDKILKETGAQAISISTGGMQLETWLRVLWKMASGFFHVVCPDSLVASQRNHLLLNEDDTWLSAPISGDTAEERERFLVRDVFSYFHPNEVRHYGSSRVYTTNWDAHTHVYCELDVLSVLSFPRYTCRILNLEGKPLQERLFAVEEKPMRVGKDIDLSFLFNSPIDQN